jgi:phenylalanyl-tRNA synthetase beta chain
MGNSIVGFAGELHPRVVQEYGLPLRSCAFELDVEAISYLNSEVVTASRIKTFPLAKIDLAFVVDHKLPVSVVVRAIESAGIEELDSVDLFDVYQGEQVPQGSKSVAVSLTFRALDRTLTDAEIADLRIKAISAAESLGATLR